MQRLIILILSLLTMTLAQATVYRCVPPSMIQVKKEPLSGIVQWGFQFPAAGKWTGFQTEPVKPSLNILKPGTIRAIRLDYGTNGESWPIPQLTCFYLGDGQTTSSGYISVRFFNRSAAIPPINEISYSKIVYCDPDDTDACMVIVN